MYFAFLNVGEEDKSRSGDDDGEDIGRRATEKRYRDVVHVILVKPNVLFTYQYLLF